MKKIIFAALYFATFLLCDRGMAAVTITDPSDLPESLEEREPWNTASAPQPANSTSAKAAQAAGEGKTGDQNVADLFGKISEVGKKAAESGKAPDPNSLKSVFGSQGNQASQYQQSFSRYSNQSDNY